MTQIHLCFSNELKSPAGIYKLASTKTQRQLEPAAKTWSIHRCFSRFSVYLLFGLFGTNRCVAIQQKLCWRTKRPLSHWQEIGSFFELDRLVSRYPLSRNCFINWRIWVFTVSSIGTFTTDIKQRRFGYTSINDITSRLPYSAAIIFLILVLPGPQCHSAKHLRNAQLSKRCNCFHGFHGFQGLAEVVFDFLFFQKGCSYSRQNMFSPQQFTMLSLAWWCFCLFQVGIFGGNMSDGFVDNSQLAEHHGTHL